MADMAVVVLFGWSLILGEILLKKCTESEPEVRLIITNGHLEEKRNELIKNKIKLSNCGAIL